MRSQHESLQPLPDTVRVWEVEAHNFISDSGYASGGDGSAHGWYGVGGRPLLPLVAIRYLLWVVLAVSRLPC